MFETDSPGMDLITSLTCSEPTRKHFLQSPRHEQHLPLLSHALRAFLDHMNMGVRLNSFPPDYFISNNMFPDINKFHSLESIIMMVQELADDIDAAIIKLNQ